MVRIKSGLVAAAAASLCAVSFSAQAAAAGGQARVVVAYKAGNAAQARAAVARLGGQVRFELAEVNAMAITLPRGVAAKLKAVRGIDFVEEDSIQRIQRLPASQQARKSAVPQAGGTQVTPYGIPLVQADQIAGTPAWQPKVCIIDSGIDGTHEDLAGNLLAGKNYTTSGLWNTDEDAHGTHVAGTVAALDNSVGVVGVAGNKQFKLQINKVFDATGSAPSSTIARAMLGCLVARANVVSMSLGGSAPSQLQQRVADLMTARGLLLIAAAGNAGDSSISYPAGFANVMSVAAVDSSKGWASFSQFNADVEIAAPGVAVDSTVPAFSQIGGKLTVGAATYAVQGMDGSPLAAANGPLADFGLGDAPSAGSMSGKVCLISRGSIAFSDKVLNCQNSGGVGAVIYNNTSGELLGTLNGVATTIPSVGALQSDGATMLGQVGQSATVGVEKLPDLYAAFNGTSMATPHVSAVAALVWSYYPACTAEQIRATLNKSAQDIGDPGRDDKTGNGLVQARAAFDRIATLGCGN